MVAHLLESRQTRQHQALAFDALAGFRLLQKLIGHRLVEGGLLLAQLAELGLLDLARQVGQDRPVALEAAQQKRGRKAPQPLGRRCVLVALDRQGEALAELGQAAQQAWIEQVQQGPQFMEAVFHRRAGESNPALAAQAGGGPSHGGVGIFQLLSLVKHQPAPAQARQGGGVAAEHAIAGEQHAAGAEFLHRPPQRRRRTRPLRAVVQPHHQVGRESLQLPPPVAQQRHRRHHQGGRLQRIGQQGGDQLGGLAQAHVIRQAGPKPQSAQKHQPAQAPLLVGPQLTPERLRGGQSLGALVQIPRQQAAQRPGSLHPRQLQLRRQLQFAKAEGTAQQVCAAGLRTLAGQAQQAGDRRRIHQGPLAPQPHQRPLHGRRPLQAGQLRCAQGPIAQHRLPLKLKQPRQIQAGAAPRRGRLAPLAGW